MFINFRLFIAVFLLATFFLISSIQNKIFASSTVMSITPNSGTFNTIFEIKLIVDGKGDRFNAASSNVVLSDNLSIDSIELGDCNFSFLKTPTVNDPSFEGIILSSYSEKCTVYILNIRPIQKGNGSIELLEPIVKQYGDATDVLSSSQGGSYFLSAAISNPTKKETVNSDNLFSLKLKVTSSNKPFEKGEVLLSNSLKQILKSKTDEKGEVFFSQLEPGIYDISIEKDKKLVARNIINVEGQNKNLSLSINLDSQNSNPLIGESGNVLTQLAISPIVLVFVTVVGLTLGIITTSIFFKYKSKSR